MDLLDHLCIRFHFGGEFFNDGKFVHYLGGSEALSWIDRDKVSLPEIRGHLQDHCEITEDTLLHWLFPEKELSNGLRVLTNDKTCIVMRDCIIDGGVADIYVDSAEEETDGDDDHEEGSDFEEEMQDLNCVEMELEGDEVGVTGSKQDIGKKIVTQDVGNQSATIKFVTSGSKQVGIVPSTPKDR